MRSSYADGTEGGLRKLFEDEEGAVGRVLMMLLKEYVGEDVWRYKPSHKYAEFSDSALRWLQHHAS